MPEISKKADELIAKALTIRVAEMLEQVGASTLAGMYVGSHVLAAAIQQHPKDDRADALIKAEESILNVIEELDKISAQNRKG